MKKSIGNGLQADAIRRYHLHLQKQGRAGSIEESARRWIKLYAAAWRRQHQINPKRMKLTA